MTKMSILTSNSTTTQPSDPSLTSADWARQNYTESAYDAVGTIDFQSAVIATHVAVYSENDNNSGLSLAEVVVFGYWVLRL